MIVVQDTGAIFQERPDPSIIQWGLSLHQRKIP